MSIPASERKEKKAPTEEYLLASEMGESLKLLPCPFCGSDKIYYKKYQTVVGERWSTLCGDCLAEIDCGYAVQRIQAADLWNKRAPAPNIEVKEVYIPLCDEHEGVHGIKVNLRWVCPTCGKPRGQIKKVKSYDGSLVLFCDGWDNPCGHVDYYANCRAEAANNGLNPNFREVKNERA